MNDVFKALSDPTRRRILELLYERDMTAGDIADAFNISKPSISHHLNILKKTPNWFSRNERDRILSIPSIRHRFNPL